MYFEFEPSIVAFGSALLGGSFTLLGQLFSFRLANQAKAIQEQKELASLLASFAVEIESLFERYIKAFGYVFEHNSVLDGLRSPFIADQDYMTVFNANADQIGRITNSNLRKLILQTYTSTKSLLDSYKMNNLLLNQVITLEYDVVKTATNSQLNNLLEQKKVNLKNYVIVLRNIHFEYKSNVEQVLILIQSEITAPTQQ